MNIPTLNGPFLLTRVAVLNQLWRKSVIAMLEFRCVLKLDDAVFIGERLMVPLEDCVEPVREFARDHMMWTYPIVAIGGEPKFVGFCCSKPYQRDPGLAHLVEQIRRDLEEKPWLSIDDVHRKDIGL